MSTPAAICRGVRNLDNFRDGTKVRAATNVVPIIKGSVKLAVVLLR
jgi:hypothetical protein